METRKLAVAGRTVELAEAGKGAPLLYLHGIADIHAASAEWLPFHETLARTRRVIAPAHPCCAGSDEDESIETIDDLAFRYIETIDALGLARVDLVGACVGGWIAAELAVRHPERFGRLALIGASGLFVAEHPIGDLFWQAQPRDGNSFAGLRKLLFAEANAAAGVALFPDTRAEVERELRRYKTMRFASRIGFQPPYFYNPKLRERLHRYGGPVLLLWGAEDRMVPRAHGEAYRAGFANARLKIVAGAGHSPHFEQPRATAKALADFLAAPAPAKQRLAKRAKSMAKDKAKRPKPKAKAKAKAHKRRR